MASEIAPRLHPNVSASTGRNTPKAANGLATAYVTMKRAMTIAQRPGEFSPRLA